MRPPNKRALVALPDLVLGGSILSAVEIAARIHEQSLWNVSIYAPGGPARRVIEERGLTHIEAPELGRMPVSPGAIAHLRRTVREHNIDLVHAWDWHMLHRCYLGLQFTGFPVLGSWTAMSVPRGLPHALPIGFVTPEIRDQDRRRSGRNFVQEYPINFAEDDPASIDRQFFRSEYGIGADQTLLAIVSRLSTWMKRESIARSIEATRLLAAEHDVVLAVVGDGDAGPELRALGEEVNRSIGRNVVRFTGALVDPRPAYAAADISLGMGTSIVRAMAFGVPGIVVGERGFCSLYDERSADGLGDAGFYGFDRPEGANERLAEIIRPLLGRADLRHQLGAWSAKTVMSRFTVERTADVIAAQYDLSVSTPVRRSPVAFGRELATLGRGMTAQAVKSLVPNNVKTAARRRHTVPLTEIGVSR
jgi:L-malate glycosyltransferase